MSKHPHTPVMRPHSSWISFAIWATIAFSIFFPWGVNSFLKYSLQKGDMAGAMLALQLRANPNYPYAVTVNKDKNIEKESCFIHAIKISSRRAEPILRAMIRRGGDPCNVLDESSTKNVWEVAFARNDISLVKLMLDENAKRDGDPMGSAIECGTPEMVALLESHGVHWDDAGHGESMLHGASEMGNTELVEYLLKKGFPINEPRQGMSYDRNKDRETPLMLAIDGSYIDTAEYLIAQGADVTSRDAHRQSVLHHAIEAYHLGNGEFGIPQKAKHFIQLLRERVAKKANNASQKGL